MTTSDKKIESAEKDLIIDTHSAGVEPSKEELELRALLESDARRAATKSNFGNAIEKQKNQAKPTIPDSSSSSGQSSSASVTHEYQYHGNRILTAVVIGLLVFGLIGWGVYLLSRSDDSTSDAAYEFTTITVGDEEADATGANNDDIAANLDQLESAGAPAQTQTAEPLVNDAAPVSKIVKVEKPEPISAPSQPKLVVQQPTISTAEQQPGKTGILNNNAIARENLSQGVEQLEPVGIYTDGTVSLNGKTSARVFYFTQFTNLAGQVASHRWYFNDSEVARIDMNIGSNSWRASSNKGLTQNIVGQWRVEAVDANNTVLSRQTFQVTP